MQASGQLAGKVAIVTGASSGIGLETAKLYAREGASVVLVARRAAELDRLAASIEAAGGRALAVAGDVRDEALARDAVTAAVERFGGLDIAFNNAGAMGPSRPLHEIEPQEWQDVLQANLTSAYLGARHQIPAMLARGGGSLIFTSTFVGYTAGFPGMGAYAASKAGLIGLTQVIASEYGARGIRANAAARRHRHADGARRHGLARGPRLRREPARAQAPGHARRDRALGAVPGVGRVQLHHRHGAAGRWRGLGAPGLKRFWLLRVYP